mmetsp:Transcript_72495/g.160138  ORF Transcript_72495/g.160138 Transcript_72495/m.160138 type:complete len:218 (+) Transcript_72495:110-763(+)
MPDDKAEEKEKPEAKVDPNLKPAESLGSKDHGTGECKPCAWYWKPQGCRNGKDCAHCHMCEKDELKNRKKRKAASNKKPAPERRRTSPRRSPRRSRTPDRRRPDAPYEPNGESYRAYYERAYGTPPPHPNPYYYPPADPRYPPPAYGYPPPAYGYYPPGYGYPPPYGYPPAGYGYPPPGPGYDAVPSSRARSRGSRRSGSESISESPSPKNRRRAYD